MRSHLNQTPIAQLVQLESDLKYYLKKQAIYGKKIEKTKKEMEEIKRIW